MRYPSDVPERQACPTKPPGAVTSTADNFGEVGSRSLLSSSSQDTRSHFSELFHRASQDLQRSIDFFHRVRASERETQTCPRLLIGKAHRSKYMRRFQRAGSARRTGRTTDALLVQDHQNRFGINPPDR